MNADDYPGRGTLLLGGLTGLATAVTTILLWYLPRTYSVDPGPDGLVDLHAVPAYMARLWINYVHVFLALLAYGVVAAAVRRTAPTAAAIGFVAFLIWCVAEAIGVSINLWAVNETWRAGLAGADPAAAQLIRASLHTAAGIWDGVFFVVLTAFLIGTVSYGIALASESALQRLVGALFLLAGPLTLIIMLDGYFGASLSPWVSWSYPILQPVSRASMGVWLLMLAARQPLPGSRRGS